MRRWATRLLRLEVNNQAVRVVQRENLERGLIALEPDDILSLSLEGAGANDFLNNGRRCRLDRVRGEVLHLEIKGVTHAPQVDYQLGCAVDRNRFAGALLGRHILVTDEISRSALAREFKDNAVVTVVGTDTDIFNTQVSAIGRGSF